MSRKKQQTNSIVNFVNGIGYHKYIFFLVDSKTIKINNNKLNYDTYYHMYSGVPDFNGYILEINLFCFLSKSNIFWVLVFF